MIPGGPVKVKPHVYLYTIQQKNKFTLEQTNIYSNKTRENKKGTYDKQTEKQQHRKKEEEK